MKKFLCKIGIHKWIQSRNVTCIDIFPPSMTPYKTPERICKRCGKQQKWLPGYGGSELGCWI